MFESVVSNLIVKYLGKYIAIPPDSLNISLFSGNVELRNVKIKQSATYQFEEIPVTVIQGNVGKLNIQIPWSSLKSSPVIVNISNVFLVVRPNRCCTWDEYEESKKDRAIKRSKLRMSEALKNKSLKKSTSFSSSEMLDSNETDPGFVAKLTETILNNIQITVENVHIRYEDVLDRANPIIFGITLEKLELSSCDEYWDKIFVKHSLDFLLKMVDLHNLVFYSSKELLPKKSMTSVAEFSQEMSISPPRGSRPIFGPISGNLKATIQYEDKLDVHLPRIKLDTFFEQISANLSNEQYYDLLKTLDYFIKYKFYEEFRKFRPLMKPSSKETRQLWWHYLCKCVNSIVQRKHFSWDQVEERSRDKKRFIELYKKKLKLSWSEPATQEELREYKQLLNKIDYEDLLFYKELAESEIKHEASEYEKLREVHKANRGWFGWARAEAKVLVQLDEDQRQELYKSIGYTAQQQATVNTLPKSFIQLFIKLDIQQGSIQLLDKQRKCFIEVFFSNVSLGLKKREVSSQFTASIHDVLLLDRYTTNPNFEKVFYRREKNQTPLIDFSIESSIQNNTSHTVRLDLEGVNILLNVFLIQQILSFLVIPGDWDFNTVKKAIKRTLAQWKLQDLASFSKAVLDLKIQAKSPKLIIPEKASELIANDAVLIADLGNFILKSSMDSSNKMDDVVSHNINLSDIQVAALTYEDWSKDISLETEKTNQILDKISLSFDAKQLLHLMFTSPTSPMSANFASMPSQWNLTCQIPSIDLYFNPSKVVKCIKVYNTFAILLDDPIGLSKTQVELSCDTIKYKVSLNDEWSTAKIELKHNNLLLYSSSQATKAVMNLELTHLMQIAVDDNTILFSAPQSNLKVENVWIQFSLLNDTKEWVSVIQSKLDIMKQDFASSELDQFSERQALKALEKLKKRFTSPNIPWLNLNVDLSCLAIHFAFGETIFSQLQLSGTHIVFHSYMYYETTEFKINKFVVQNVPSQTKVFYFDSSLRDMSSALFTFTTTRHSKKLKQRPFDVKSTLRHLDIVFDRSQLVHYIKFLNQLLDAFDLVQIRTKHIISLESDKVKKAIDSIVDKSGFEFFIDGVNMQVVDENTVEWLHLCAKNVIFGIFFAKNGTFKLDSQLTDLRVIDTTKDAMIPELFCVQKDVSSSSSNIKFVLQTFDTSHLENSNEPFFNSSFTAYMDQIKIVYFRRLVRRVKLYFLKGDLMDALEYRLFTKEEAATHKSLSLRHYEIVANKPRGIFPAAYDCTDLGQVDLEYVKVYNQIRPIGDAKWKEEVILEARNASLLTVIDGKHQIIVEHVNGILTRTIEYQILEAQKLLPLTYDFQLNFEKGELRADHNQYCLVFAVIGNNFFDTTFADSFQQQQQQQSLIPTHYALTCKQVTFDFLNPNDESIIQLQMQQFVLEQVESIDRRNIARLTVSKVDGWDHLTKETKFPHFLATSSASLSTNSIPDVVMEYETTKGGDSIFHMQLGYLRCLIIPDLYLEMYEFLTQHYNSRFTKPVDITQNVIGLVVEKRPIVKFSLIVNGTPKFVFCEDIFNAKALCFVLESNVALNFNKSEHIETGILHLDKASMFVESSYLQAALEGTKVLEPISVFASLQSEMSDNGKWFTRQLTIDIAQELQLRIGYGDVLMFYRIVQVFTNMRAKAALFLYSNFDIPISISSESNSLEPLQQPIQLIDTEQQTYDTRYVISFANQNTMAMNVLLVDDRRGFDIPLLHVHISQIRLDPCAEWMVKQNLINATVYFQLELFFYNSTVAKFEPLLEAWMGCLDYSRKLNTNHFLDNPMQLPMLHELQVFSVNHEEVLQVNITKPLIDTLVDMWNMWQHQEGFFAIDNSTVADESTQQQYYPYFVKNKTGMEVKLVWENNQREPIHIANNKEMGISFEENMQRTDFSIWKSDLTIGIQLQFSQDSPAELQWIHVRQVGKTIVTHENMTCIIDVEQVEYQKRITLRSGIQIKNSTEVDWCIGMLEVTNQQVELIETLKPNQITFIPVMADLKSNLLKIKPSVGQYEWSKNNNWTMEAMCTVSTKPKSYLLTCQSNATEDMCHCLIRTITVSEHDLLMELIPPLRIENVLPFPYEMELFSRSSQFGEKKSICKQILAPGEHVNIYSTNLTTVLLLQSNLLPSEKWTRNEQLSVIYQPAQQQQQRSSYNVSRTSLSKTTTSTNNPNALSTDFVLHAKESDNMVAFQYDFQYPQNTSMKELHAYYQVSIYCHYWLWNQTGVTLFFKKPSQKEDDPIIFKSIPQANDNQVECFHLMNMGKKSQICFAVEDETSFSKPFHLEQVGINGDFQLINSDKKIYDIGIYISIAPGKFSKSKLIRFSARYVFVNETPYHLKVLQFLQEHQQNGLSLAPKERKNFFWTEKQDNPQIQIQLCEEELLSEYQAFSTHFPLTSLGDVHLKLLPKKEFIKTKQVIILCANVIQEYGSLIITLTVAQPPYVIDNQCPFEVEVSQDSKKWWYIASNSQLPYAWDDVCKPSLLKLSIQGIVLPKALDLNQVSSEEKVSVTEECQVYLQIDAEGPTRTLRIKSTPKIITQSQQSQQSQQSEKYIRFKCAIELPKFGVSLIQDPFIEIAFLYVEEIRFKCLITDKNQYLECMIDNLQLDNHIRRTRNPVVFGKSFNSDKSQKFIRLSIMRSRQFTTIDMFEYFSFNIQEADLILDVSFVQSVIDMFERLTVLWNRWQEEEDSLPWNEEPSKSPSFFFANKYTRDYKLYFAKLELHPIQINLSLKFGNSEVQQSNTNSLISKYKVFSLLKEVGFLMDIDQAPIKFNALILDHPFVTTYELMDRLFKHYSTSLLLELYKVIGSLDIIGNPVGLFNEIGTGVKALFYEPAQAWVNSTEEIRKEKVLTSVKKGASDLLQKSVHGISNTNAKITGNLSTALSKITFDQEWIANQQKMQKKKVSSVKEGLKDGTTAVVKGIVAGSVDLIYQPIIGAKSEGFKGFMKGLGKGYIGYYTKPIIGILQFQSKLAQGISNTQQADHHRQKSRIRFPRIFENGEFTPYDENRSYAQYLIDMVEDETSVQQIQQQQSSSQPSHAQQLQSSSSSSQLSSLATNQQQVQEVDLPEMCILNEIDNQVSVAILTRKFVYNIKLGDPMHLVWKIEVALISALTKDSKGAIVLTYQTATQKSGFLGLSTYTAISSVHRKIFNRQSAVLDAFYEALCRGLALEHNRVMEAVK